MKSRSAPIACCGFWRANEELILTTKWLKILCPNVAAYNEMTKRAIEITVNGKRYEALVEPRVSLADFLRDDLGLTGTHVGCEQGICGSCTILLNGESVRACLLLAVQANGATI